jgi:hypothetical protein
MICPRPHGLYHFAPVGERGSRLAGSPWTIYGPWHQSSGPGAQRSALPGSSLARGSTQSSSRTLRVLGSSVPRGGAVALILAYRVERTLAHLHCGCAELTGVRVPVFVFPVFTAHGPQALLLHKTQVKVVTSSSTTELITEEIPRVGLRCLRQPPGIPRPTSPGFKVQQP